MKNFGMLYTQGLDSHEYHCNSLHGEVRYVLTAGGSTRTFCRKCAKMYFRTIKHYKKVYGHVKIVSLEDYLITKIHEM